MTVKRVAPLSRRNELAGKAQARAALARYAAMTRQEIEAEVARMTAAQREAVLAALLFAVTRIKETAP